LHNTLLYTLFYACTKAAEKGKGDSKAKVEALEKKVSAKEQQVRKAKLSVSVQLCVE